MDENLARIYPVKKKRESWVSNFFIVDSGWLLIYYNPWETNDTIYTALRSRLPLDSHFP